MSISSLFASCVQRLSDLGVHVPAGSRFDIMRRCFEDKGGPGRTSIPTHDLNFRIALEALRDIQLLDAILRNIDKVDVGSVALERLVRDPPLPHSGNISRGRDLQAELLVAAACVSGGMKNVRLTEPDVAATIDEERWGIAVKRVKSQSRITDNIKEAARQAHEAHIPAAIYIDVSQALDPDDEQMITPMTDEAFNLRLRDGMRQAIR